MKVLMQLLSDRITTTTGHLHLLQEKETRSWYQMHHVNPAWIGQEGILLYGRAEEFEDTMEGQGLVSLGKPSEKLLASNDILWFENVVEYEALFIELQKIFLKFNTIEEEMNEILKRRGTLQELTEKAVSLFDNSLIIHDQDFFQLSAAGMTGKEHSWEFDEKRNCYRLSYEILNDFKINRDYLKTMRTKGAQIFPDETFGYNILYQNLWYHGEYRGRILVNEVNRRVTAGDAYLLERFAEITKEYFRLGMSPKNRRNFQMAAMLRSLLAAETVDPEFFNSVLLYNGWTRHDEYFCACLFPQAGDRYTHAMQYHCTRLSEAYPASCVFEKEDHIVILMNVTLTECTIKRFQSQIAVQLREGLMKAGVSQMGQDLRDFSYLYDQAVCAYETGKSSRPMFWSFTFDEYRLDFLLRHALEKLPVRFLIRPEIRILKDHDAKHPSELERTLKEYLFNERALLKTAEILEIHRTTLLYRIRKIGEMTGLELDDEKTRFELLTSFYLMQVDQENQERRKK